MIIIFCVLCNLEVSIVLPPPPNFLEIKQIGYSHTLNTTRNDEIPDPKPWNKALWSLHNLACFLQVLFQTLYILHVCAAQPLLPLHVLAERCLPQHWACLTQKDRLSSPFPFLFFPFLFINLPEGLLWAGGRPQIISEETPPPALSTQPCRRTSKNTSENNRKSGLFRTVSFLNQ